MSDPAVKRPPILTGACLYLGLLSAVISVRAVSLVSSWNAESRADEVATYLTAMRDAGMGAESAESAYKVFATVVAVLGAMGVIFAIYTARGDRASRIGMTVTVGTAGLLTFLGALGTSFFLTMLGALALVFTIRLWTGQIRTYFRTLAGHPPPEPKVAEPAPVAVSQTPAGGFAPPQHGAAPQYYAPPPGYAPPRREPLPTPVAFAVWSTLIGSVVAVGLSALILLILLVGGVDYDVLMERGGPGTDMIGSESDFDLALSFLTVISSVAIVLGLAGAAVSVLALVRRRSGGVPLFFLAVVTIVVSGLAFPIGLPWTVLAIVVLFQLRRPESKAWFATS